MGPRTLVQFFHWYSPSGGHLWAEVKERAKELAAIGVTDVWLPPAYKGAAGGYSVGYDTYDLFDLGEFDQKGTVATKYGTRKQLDHATRALKNAGIRVLHDVVFNHKMGADESEVVSVRRVNRDDRQQIEAESFEARASTRFTFPGRNGHYSKFIWDKSCFSGVDRLNQPEEQGIFRLENEYGEGQWNDEVDEEFGNYDYLMGSDVEFRNRAVYEELKYWGRWLAGQLPVDGFRLDAAKHIPAWFFRGWVGHMRDTVSPDLFVVAEYWSPDFNSLQSYLDLVDKQLHLFDVSLQHRFHAAARQGADFDMRTIFDGSLVAAMPDHAVTLVENHDTQPLQSLEAPVEPWFKPIAYALILLRRDGVPCVFFPDLYGAKYKDQGADGNEYEIEMPTIPCLSKLIEARSRFANGEQTDFFDDPSCIGFRRHGSADLPGCVVIMSNAEPAEKMVELGPEHVGSIFMDFLGNRGDEITVGDDGKAIFPTDGGSVSVWVSKESQ